MTYSVSIHSHWGSILWLAGNGVKLGVALDFGIRIVYAACEGMENLFYEQPDDLSDGYYTSEGWRLYGGHRMWPAPESCICSAPDNSPIHWIPEGNGVLLRQDPDTATGLEKNLQLHFTAGGSILLEHSLKNVSDRQIICASWGISSMAPGGTARIDFSADGQPSFQPQRTVALWQDTALNDPRLHFSKDTLTVSFLPLDNFCKLGLYSRCGRAVYENNRQRLIMTFAAPPAEQLPDSGCNFELFLCRHFMELETLGTLSRLAPGEAAYHWETWRFERL